MNDNQFQKHLKLSQIIVETTFPNSKLHALGQTKRTLPITTFNVQDGDAYCDNCNQTLTHYEPFLRRDVDAQCPQCHHYLSPLSKEELGQVN